MDIELFEDKNKLIKKYNQDKILFQTTIFPSLLQFLHPFPAKGLTLFIMEV